jgi:hypothetical protein
MPTTGTANKWTQVVEVAASLGLVAGIGYFIFWNEQSGFFGAFSVTPEQVGVTSGARIERLSLAAAVIVSLIGAAVIVVELFRVLIFGHVRYKTPIKTWKDDPLYRLILSVGLLLQAGLIGQALNDHRGQPNSGVKHTVYAGIAVAAATLGALFWRRRWKTGQRSLAVAVVAATFLVSLAGYAVNAWAYDLGNKLRDGNPSAVTFLIGKTPPDATVTWHDPPPGVTNPMNVLFLGEANEQFVMYDRTPNSNKVLLIPRDAVDLRISPHPG